MANQKELSIGSRYLRRMQQAHGENGHTVSVQLTNDQHQQYEMSEEEKLRNTQQEREFWHTKVITSN